MPNSTETQYNNTINSIILRITIQFHVITINRWKLSFNLCTPGVSRKSYPYVYFELNIYSYAGM